MMLCASFLIEVVGIPTSFFLWANGRSAKKWGLVWSVRELQEWDWYIIASDMDSDNYLSEEWKVVQARYYKWLDKNHDSENIEDISESISITNEWLAVQVGKFRYISFGMNWENLKNGSLSINEIGSAMRALWGSAWNPGNNFHMAWEEIVSFLIEVAGIEPWIYETSSSVRKVIPWRVHIEEKRVYANVRI